MEVIRMLGFLFKVFSFVSLSVDFRKKVLLSVIEGSLLFELHI